MLAAFLGRTESMVSDVVAELLAVEEYARLEASAPVDLGKPVRWVVETFTECLDQDRPLAPEEIRRFEDLGRERRSQGIPLETVTSSLDIGLRHCWVKLLGLLWERTDRDTFEGLFPDLVRALRALRDAAKEAITRGYEGVDGTGGSDDARVIETPAVEDGESPQVNRGVGPMRASRVTVMTTAILAVQSLWLAAGAFPLEPGEARSTLAVGEPTAVTHRILHDTLQGPPQAEASVHVAQNADELEVLRSTFATNMDAPEVDFDREFIVGIVRIFPNCVWQPSVLWHDGVLTVSTQRTAPPGTGCTLEVVTLEWAAAIAHDDLPAEVTTVVLTGSDGEELARTDVSIHGPPAPEPTLPDTGLPVVALLLLALTSLAAGYKLTRRTGRPQHGSS